MNVKPVSTDGNWTIGYDDLGRAGEWPGNLESTCEERDFMLMKLNASFSDGNIEYLLIESQDGSLIWTENNE